MSIKFASYLHHNKSPTVPWTVQWTVDLQSITPTVRHVASIRSLVFKNNDAAWLLKEEDIDNGIFIKSISQIINNPNLLKKFSFNNIRLRKPLAAKKLKKLILSL